MGRILVGLWDCEYCGTTKISGETRDCPNCGRPRGENVKFYLDSTKNYVKEPEKVNKNPDWLCPYCNSLNSDSVTACVSCGHPRESSDLNYFENHEKQAEKRSHQEPAHDFETYEQHSYEPEDYTHNETSSYRSSNYQNNFIPSNEQNSIFSSFKFNGRKTLFASIAIILCFLIVFALIPKTKTITVDSVQWERNIEVEQYKTVEESGWSLPSGAWGVSQRQEIYSYDHVIDHYETKTRQVSEQVFDGYDISYSYRDLGNGHFEEIEHQTPRYRTEYHTETYQDPVYKDVPVYKTKYYYNIEKWVFDHNETTSGINDKPYFADLTLERNFREGERTEKYWVIDTKGNKYTSDFSIWSAIKSGQTIKVKIRTGKIIELKS